MSIPRAAQIRQLQAQARRNKLEENAVSGDLDRRDSMFAKHNQQLRQPPPNTRTMGGNGFGGRFSSTNRVQRDPNQGVITAREFDEMVQKREESGRGFRVVFGVCCAAVLLLLMFAKYDVEVNLEMPQIESGSGFGEEKDYDDGAANAAPKGGGAAGTVSEVEGAEMDEMYKILNVQGRLKKPERRKPDAAAAAADASSSAKVDRDKQRRRDNYRVRQELKAAYTAHQDGIGQLVHCGRSCEAKNQQVELAYTAIASQIDRPLESVLFDEGDSRRSGRGWKASELKEMYEKKVAAAMETETDPDDRAMAVEELKDAYSILSNPEATTYMRLMGRKPPELMKHMSQRDGGWGEKLQTGQHKNRLIFAWLDYFNNPWAETFVLGMIAVFMLMRLPAALKQTHEMVDQLEWEDKREAQNRKNEEGGGDEDEKDE